MLTHQDKVAASNYAVNIDHVVTVRDCGKEYAEMREIWLSIGTFRAIEYLEKNGWEITKKEKTE